MTALEEIALKFQSSNTVPVERVTITADEFARLQEQFSAMEQNQDES